MLSVSKLDFLDDYYYEKYRKYIDKSVKEEALHILNKFFTDRGYRLLDIKNRGTAYPVSIIFAKDGTKQVFKTPMITFEKYHLNNSLGFMFDSLKKSGVLK